MIEAAYQFRATVAVLFVSWCAKYSRVYKQVGLATGLLFRSHAVVIHAERRQEDSFNEKDFTDVQFMHAICTNVAPSHHACLILNCASVTRQMVPYFYTEDAMSITFSFFLEKGRKKFNLMIRLHHILTSCVHIFLCVFTILLLSRLMSWWSGNRRRESKPMSFYFTKDAAKVEIRRSKKIRSKPTQGDRPETQETQTQQTSGKTWD